MLAYLRKGETFASLGAGFAASTATAWCYVQETTALLADRALSLWSALRKARADGHGYLIVDGTLIPVDRVAVDRPFYSGRYRCHGMNVQVIAALEGSTVGLSPALPGSMHDAKAA